MIQCPNCFEMLPDSVPSGKCPKCGKALAGPTSAKTANFHEATVEGTLDLELDSASANISPSATITFGPSG